MQPRGRGDDRRVAPGAFASRLRGKGPLIGPIPSLCFDKGKTKLFQKGEKWHAERTYSEPRLRSGSRRSAPLVLRGGWIRRRYRTMKEGQLMVINTVGHLSEAAWHHPDITASYAWVEVRLQNHAAKGITDKDFELAKKIEDVVHWQPGKEGGALEGTPAEDMRFSYIKYDKPKA
jgi:4a-hydroxytetrahydrobiopterin dehydratase